MEKKYKYLYEVWADVCFDGEWQSLKDKYNGPADFESEFDVETEVGDDEDISGEDFEGYPEVVEDTMQIDWGDFRAFRISSLEYEPTPEPDIIY
jgi:hypothetical protein